MKDGIGGTSTYYEYDLAGRQVAANVTGASVYDPLARGTTEYADGTGLVEKQSTTIFKDDGSVAKSLSYLYAYCDATSSGGAGTIGGFYVNNEGYSYIYDSLGRLVTFKTTLGSEDEGGSLTQQIRTGKREEYTYVDNSNGTTTTLVKTFRDMLGELHTESLKFMIVFYNGTSRAPSPTDYIVELSFAIPKHS